MSGSKLRLGKALWESHPAITPLQSTTCFKWGLAKTVYYTLI